MRSEIASAAINGEVTAGSKIRVAARQYWMDFFIFILLA
jgi:hypothetical protein